MKMSEYVKSEKEKIKDKPFKERLAYFWDYYKWYVLIGVIVLFLIGQTVSTVLEKKDAVLSGLLIDGIAPLETPAVIQTFYEANGIDPTKEEVELNTGVSLDSELPNVVANSYQMIHARVGAEDVDFIIGYEYAVQRLGYDPSRMFADLRTVLSADTLASLEGKLYYIDGDVLAQIKAAPTEAIPLPDPKKPEEMVDPIPVAVDISANANFTSLYYAADKAVYIAVVTNAPHKALAARLVELLIS